MLPDFSMFSRSVSNSPNFALAIEVCLVSVADPLSFPYITVPSDFLAYFTSLPDCVMVK